MAELLIRIKKKPDGSAALTCVRADGSVTWQRQEGTAGRFFPMHDLTHYAVETVLGHRRGFYGLIAEGWDLTDFGAPWPKGPLPADAEPAELIVGFLDVERASGGEWSAAEFNAHAAAHSATRGGPSTCALTDEHLACIRARRQELLVRWRALKPGEALELEYSRRA